MKTKIGRIFLGTTLGFFMVQCTPEQSTRKRTLGDHEVLGTEVSQDKRAQKSPLEDLMNRVETLVQGQVGLEQEQVDAQMLLTEVINPLREVVLNRDLILSQENRNIRTESGRFIISRLISLFNEAVLLTYGVSPALILQTDLFPRYKENILWDCDKKLRGTCEMIRIFRQVDSPNMSRIMKLIHDQEPSDLEKVRLIWAAFDLKNRRLDGPLRFMLLSRLAKSLNQEKEGSINPVRRRRDVNLFTNILKINVDQFSDEDKYREFILALEPWALSRNIEDDKNSALSEIIKLAGRYLLYNKDGSLSQGLLHRNSQGKIIGGAIHNLLYVVRKDYEQGALFQQKNIKGEWKKRYSLYLREKNRSDELAQGVGSESMRLTELERKIFSQVESLEYVRLYDDRSQKILQTLLKDSLYEAGRYKLDEFFYLTHQVFFGHFSLEDGQMFWEQTHKADPKTQVQLESTPSEDLYRSQRILDETEKILKRQVVNNIVYTNSRMNDFYNRRKNSSVIELLRESSKEASKIRKSWSKLIVRANIIKNFLSIVVRRDTLKEELQAQYDRVNRMIEALAKNIKFLVTYPSMFPLMHIMAAGELNDTFYFWGRPISIDSSTIISIFFSGKFLPWFNFGNDDANLDAIEVLYTYYYTLVTQTFETYSANEHVTFDNAQFFDVVVKKLIFDVRNSIDQKTQKLKQELLRFKNMAASMERICDEERYLQSREGHSLKLFMENHIHGLRGTVNSKRERNPFFLAKGAALPMSPRREILNNIEFRSLDSNIYNGNQDSSGKIGEYLDFLYSSDVQTVFNIMYKKIKRHELTAHMLFSIYKLSTGNEAETDEIQRIFDREFGEYEKIKAEYIRLYFNAEEKVGGCEWVLLERTKNIQHLLFFREVQELSILFDNVWRVVSQWKGASSRGQGQSSEEEAPIYREEGQSVKVHEALEEVRRKFGASTQNPRYEGVNPIDYPESYVARYGYNTLTTASFSSFRMDTLTRVYSYLHEMFPGQYDITPPPDWTDERFFDEASPQVISFDWKFLDNKNLSEEDKIQAKERAKQNFIEAGIKAFANQMSWAERDVSINLISRRGEILKTLYKMGPLSKHESLECPKRKPDDKEEKTAEEQRISESCVWVTAEEVINYYKKFIDWMNISPVDMEVLRLLGKNQKYEEREYEKLIKKEKENALYSYYDLIYKRVFSDDSVTQSEGLWFTPEVVRYVESTQKIGGSSFIFPHDPRLDRLFSDRYKSWMRSYFEKNYEFLEAVKKTSKFEPFSFRYRTDQVFMVGFEENQESTDRKVSLEPFISDLMFGKFEGLMAQFNNATNGHFFNYWNQSMKELRDLMSPGMDPEEKELGVEP